MKKIEKKKKQKKEKKKRSKKDKKDERYAYLKAQTAARAEDRSRICFSGELASLYIYI